MNTQNTQQLQPQTLNALNEFLTIWNQDPLATNHSLVLTGNQVSVMNETNIFLTITIPTETETPIQTTEDESDMFESLFPSVNLDELLETEETTMPSQQEDLNEETTEELLLQEPDQEEIFSPLNNSLTEFIDDLTTEKDKVFTRMDPLIGTTYEEKLQEIISRLKKENRGKQRSQLIKTLEACYYLGQLRESITEDRKRIKYTRNTLQKSLGSLRATRTWKCTERVYKILQVCGLSPLYSTTKITFSSLNELSEKDFIDLLDTVKIRSAHF